MHSSPQRVNTAVREELRQRGNLNNVIAFGVQERLHVLLNRPDYYDIRPVVRAKLRRMQGLAFDGLYLGKEERREMLKSAKRLQHPRNRDGIYPKLFETLQAIETAIDDSERHWERTGYE